MSPILVSKHQLDCYSSGLFLFLFFLNIYFSQFIFIRRNQWYYRFALPFSIPSIPTKMSYYYGSLCSPWRYGSCYNPCDYGYGCGGWYFEILRPQMLRAVRLWLWVLRWHRQQVQPQVVLPLFLLGMWLVNTTLGDTGTRHLSRLKCREPTKPTGIHSSCGFPASHPVVFVSPKFHFFMLNFFSSLLIYNLLHNFHIRIKNQCLSIIVFYLSSTIYLSCIIFVAIKYRTFGSN